MAIERNIVITKTRIDFYQYVYIHTDWEHDTILKHVSQRVFHVQKRKILIGLLRNFVIEEYAVIKNEDGVRVVLDPSDYEKLFPSTAGIRPFHIKFVFESKDVLNRLKLKHPKIMSQLSGVQDELHIRP